MSRVFCLLSVVAVAFAQHHEASFGMGTTGGASHMAQMSTFPAQMSTFSARPSYGSAEWRAGRAMDDIGSATVITKTTKTITTEGGAHPAGHSASWGASGHSAWGASDAKTMPTGHSTSDFSGFQSSGKMFASGRSLWGSDAKVVTPSAWSSESSKLSASSLPSAAWNSESKMMASGRSLWNADSKMAATGRSAWESSSAHLHKDAQPNSEILVQEFDMPEPGNYKYSFKTANGIEAHEQAAMKSEDAEAVQGVYSWEAPNGEKFAVEYVADETGYHARGAHIPEIPLAIARSLEWNAAHPEEDNAGSWKEGRSASGRSAWESESHANVPAWKSSSSSVIGSSAHHSGLSSAAWDSSAKMGAAAGRSAWVSESSASLPAWESHSKMETAAGRSAGSSLWGSSGSSRMGASSLHSSAWESQSALPAGAKITKITETRTVGAPASFSSGFSGLHATGRSAWQSGASDSSSLGGHSVTKITETKTVGAPSSLSGSALVPL